MIENSGQCTAMRTLVTGDFSEDQVKSLFEDQLIEVDTSAEAMEKAAFSGLYRGSPFSLEAGYLPGIL